MPPTLTTTPADTTGGAPREAVAPLMRGIAVLRHLTEAHGTLSLSALERATGLARSTVDRVTATLVRVGYVRLEGRDAVLAPRLAELGNSYLAALRLPELLDAHADALADALDESVSLAVADGEGIRFIHQATRRRTLSVSFRIGDLLPAERTAPGPLFAAEWSEAEWAGWRTRRAADPVAQGFSALAAVPHHKRHLGGEDFERRTRRASEENCSVDDQGIEPGLVAVAVPVRTPDGRIACVASVVSHTSRHTAASLRDTLLPPLRAAVSDMERALREAPPVPEPATARRGLAAWTGASKQELGREFNESLARGLAVLTAFGAGRAALPLSAVAEATGLSRATARRALITLEHLGYVDQHDRAFRLTPRVLELGYPPLSRTTLAQIAQPHLAALSERVHESASLAVLAGDEVQYTARVATRRIMNVHINVGTRFPAYATSMGRVLLANLPPEERTAVLNGVELRALTPRTVTTRTGLDRILAQVREDGHALVDEELEEGLRSIAVPVHDRAGTAVAAVNVAMHSSRCTPQECVSDILPELRAAVAGIEADLHVISRFAQA